MNKHIANSENKLGIWYRASARAVAGSVEQIVAVEGQITLDLVGGTVAEGHILGAVEIIVQLAPQLELRVIEGEGVL
jgi:hypothetical protein